MIFYKAKFTDKHHSVGGVIATFMGIIAVLIVIYCVNASYRLAGQGGMLLGIMGILSFVISLCGCIIGLLSFRESDKYYVFSKIGSMLCGILTIFILGIFLIGI